ncbi:MAG: asparaginase [Chitinophagales bacterium]|jgi:L-asparaginase|nr:asparaginase [Sphingobacteriales bacterium]MBP9141653.1 asparaginase [Chitinophagales bacterium]MCC7056925.1 asparaginase [Chitinophagales bacterium]MDA0198840.1 asparaginase domain-containing protein [Bacteroidota bacterium]HMS50840.1 asparaginase domain-containing protein [Chitinophagales bacterium]
MKIQIFVTGGTFDKEYDMLKGQLSLKKTHLKEIFELGRVKIDYILSELMLIDSLEMTDEQRQGIANSCEACPEDAILITHGTDTMVETAKAIARLNLAKTVVLTGALIPYKFESSDGFFNLGNALAFAQVLPPGVYIAMHGRYFEWNNVYKNRETGYFEELPSLKNR